MDSFTKRALAILYAICFFAELVAGDAGVSLPRKRQLIQATPSKWTKTEKADAQNPIIIHISLALSNTDSAVASLLDISNPESSRYGMHWSARDVATAFLPAPQVTLSVIRWLNSSGIHPARVKRSHGGCYLEIASTVKEASRLLNTTFYMFTRKDGQVQILCDKYELPEALLSYIDYIVSVGWNSTLPMKRHQAHKGSKRRRQIRSDNSSVTTVNCDKYAAPSCLRDLYGLPSNINAHPNNSFGIYEIAWATWLEEDLDLFFNTFQPTLAGRRPTVVPIDGGYLQTDFKISPFNLEADLDFEYAMALTEPLDITNIQVGDKFRLGNINNMLAAFDSYYCGTIDPSIDPLFPDPLPGGYNQSAECGTVIPPKVLSISYGDPESEFPPEYLRRQCLEFLKLGLMGVTVTVGSGDDGSQSGSHDACIDPATGVSNASTGIFSPLWPASCPWVTSVGGTQRITQPSSLSTRSVIAQEADLSKANAFVAKFSSTINTNNNTVETALNTTLGSRIINSGGGFSNVFSTPYYQDKAVAEYRVNEKENLELVNHVHNQHGRGFPDVSALAAAYLTAVDGQIKTVYGTSASAPVFASVIAIINNERLHAGKRPVGFINPTLYAHPEIFTDITTGSNQGCGFTPAFRAAKGWDPVTGLGTPQYHRMLELFLSLP